MAMDFGSRGDRRSNGRDSDEDWKADYFLNFLLPANTESGKKKLHGVPLQKKNPAHKQLITAFTTGTPEEIADAKKRFLAALMVDIQSATPNENTAFKF